MLALANYWWQKASDNNDDIVSYNTSNQIPIKKYLSLLKVIGSSKSINYFFTYSNTTF